MPEMKPQTVWDLIKHLAVLIKDWIVKTTDPLITASDDEGNSYQHIYYMPTPMLYDKENNMAVDKDFYLDDPKVYKEVKDWYIEMLIDTGRYSRQTAENTDDGWDAYVYECMREAGKYPFTLCIN